MATTTVTASPLLWIKNAATVVPAQALQVAACANMAVTAIGAGAGYLALACSTSDTRQATTVVRGVVSVRRQGLQCA